MYLTDDVDLTDVSGRTTQVYIVNPDLNIYMLKLHMAAS